jgi:hypothetical protein
MTPAMSLRLNVRNPEALWTRNFFLENFKNLQDIIQGSEYLFLCRSLEQTNLCCSSVSYVQNTAEKMRSMVDVFDNNLNELKDSSGSCLNPEK